MWNYAKLLTGVCTAALTCTMAQAQSATESQAPATESLLLEEIVVTARLRSETIQSVPLSISAVTEKEIERAGIVDIASLAGNTAGLQLDSTGGKITTTPVVRGLSQVSRSDDENNVPVFIDGVYVSGRDGIDASLLDVERIEVVKGPQSALYGRNSYAGSINYITRKPTDTASGGASFTVGDDARLGAKASLSGPLVEDVLFARVGAAYDKWNGSYGNSSLRIGGYESRFASGGLRLVLDSGFEANLNSYYAKDDVGPAPQIMFAGNCELISGALGAWCGAYPSYDDPDLSGYDTRAKGTHRVTTRSSLNMTQDVGDTVRLTSLSGYNTLKTRTFLDLDRQYKGLPFTYALPNGQTGTVNLTALQGTGGDSFDVSQEFRIESISDSPLQWLAGVSYYGYRLNTDAPYAIDTTPVPTGARLTSVGGVVFAAGLRPIPNATLQDDFFTAFFSRSRKETATYAAFGAIEYTFENNITARAELRHTSEKKTLFQYLATSTSVTDETFKYLTPRFTLDYQADTNLLLYASAARGAKAGGFNASAPTADELPFGPEFNWTYEVGVKSDLLNRKLRVNLALFNVEMDGIQITNPSTVSPTIFLTRNAGTGRSRGFELELIAKPADGLTLQGSYSLADSKFVNALDGSLRSYPSYRTNFDVSGNALPRQAKHLFNASAQYETSVTDSLDGYVRADIQYNSRKNGFTTPNLGYVEGRTVVNAKVGLIRDQLEGSLWVRNLFNDKTPLLAQSALMLNTLGRQPTVLLPDLRSIGATVSYKF
ncbi:TonB-dependent receptor [Niveispirillum lacus]|nr:TonB-dependent receptor [Niveispirillum lacus]